MKPLQTTALSPWSISRIGILAGLSIGAGTLLGSLGCRERGEDLTARGKGMLRSMQAYPPGLEDVTRFSLVSALCGRRSRRFSTGSEIPDGVLAYASTKQPVPLDPLEQILLLTAVAGNTGWHNMIYRDDSYAPHLSTYSASAGGRTFPSPAGWHVANLFYTDDEGVYYFPTRDQPSLIDHEDQQGLDLGAWLDAHRSLMRQVQPSRLYLPAREPHIEGHNTWCANRPGTTLVIPVVDVAQMMLNATCFLVSNGFCLYDDVHKNPIPGLDRFGKLVDLENPWPLSVIERESLAFATAELTTSCYAGTLMLQALGLGGWMFSGIDMYSVLGASGDPDVPGLGFRFDVREDWPVPNVTGLSIPARFRRCTC